MGIFAPMTLFRHIWMTNGCQIQNQRTKLPLGAHIPEKCPKKTPKNFVKIVIFLLGIFAPMILFRHTWMANGCQIQNQRTKLPLGAQIPEKWHITSSKVIDLWWPRLTLERSKCQCKPWMPPPNTYSCPYYQQTYRSSQVSGVETVRNANFAWHDPGNQVTVQRS